MIAMFVMAAGLTGTAAFDNDVIVKASGEIDAACAAKPALMVRWDEFGDDDPAAQALIASELTFLTTAFKTVCADAGLKGQVAKQIRKIALTQAHGAADPIVYISEGTLNVEYLWVKGEPVPDAAYVAAEIASRLRGEEAEAP